MLARCGEIGLDVTVAGDPEATISAGRTRADATVAAHGHAKVRVASRELPRISVDLQRTLGDAPAAARPMPSVERDLEVIALLGEGGMGRVLLARQHSLDREVAIKTLHDSATDKERDALLSEGAITGHLEHPAIIPVHALGVDAEGNPVLVMKRVEGVEWSELLRDPSHAAWGGDSRDRFAAHLEILMQVSNAAHFAHSRAIVHRDIKPQNVLIGRYGDVYLGDWGLAVRTDRPWQPQPLCGTPAYMAPEMVVGAAVDARTDVYLLGATLHQILTGLPRNVGVNMQDALEGAIGAAPFVYPSAVPAELAALANRATARDAAERPASALEFKQALTDYLQHKSSIALCQSGVERVAKLKRLIEDAAALGNEDTQQAIDLLGVEARFALEQALAEWRDNPAARRAMDELERLLSSRRARAAELERLARELDPSVSRRQRAIGLAALALVGVGLSIAAIVTDQRDLTTRRLLYQSFGPLAILAIMVAALRRAVLRTAFNRRVTLAGAAMIGGITLSRALGLLAGAGAAHVLVNDSLLVAVVSAMSAVLLFRWLAWTSLLLLAAATAAALRPERAMLAFSLATGAALLANVYFAWRTGADGKLPH